MSPLIENLAAVYGRETDLKELLPFPTHCPACQNRLAERRSSAAAAIIVDLAGIVEKQHVPLRCRRPSCPDFGVLYWHNYSVREGRHVFHGKLPGFRYCFMLSSVFGFSVPWLQQFHAGLVRQHASFTSEADVLTAQAACLRLLISQGWFSWRLLTRALGADMELSEMEFLKPLEDMVALFLPQLRHTFGQNMLQMRCDVVVLDGNAKNRRAVCAAALAGSSHSEHLPRTLRHTCTRTPAFRHAFCRWHCEGPMDGEDHLQVQGLGHCHLCCFLLAEKMCPCLRPQLQDVEIVRHKVVNDGQQLMVLLKETMEPQREAWVSGACVPAAVLSKYVRQVGQEKLKPRKRSHEDQSQSLGKASSPLPSASRPAGTNSPADLQQLSDSTDLMSVTCSTHKESTAAQKQLKKSAGMLCACLSDGVILHMQEIYGCESLSQRYVCVAAVKALMPSLCVVVHDDACHLHKYAARRAKDERVACLLLRERERDIYIYFL